MKRRNFIKWLSGCVVLPWCQADKQEYAALTIPNMSIPKSTTIQYEIKAGKIYRDNDQYYFDCSFVKHNPPVDLSKMTKRQRRMFFNVEIPNGS